MTHPGPAPAPPATRQATGQAVLAELQRQRATIQHAAQQTAEIDASVASSEGILKRMGRWWNF